MLPTVSQSSFVQKILRNPKHFDSIWSIRCPNVCCNVATLKKKRESKSTPPTNTQICTYFLHNCGALKPMQPIRAPVPTRQAFILWIIRMELSTFVGVSHSRNCYLIVLVSRAGVHNFNQFTIFQAVRARGNPTSPYATMSSIVVLRP